MIIKTSWSILGFFVVFFFFFFFFLSSMISVSIAIPISLCGKSETIMAEASTVSPATSSTAAVYIVYTEKPAEDVDLESFHLQTLSSVLGSEEAAKSALIYVYKTAASGFSAKLTPEQAAELEKQPGVLQVVPDQALQLHSGSAVGTMNLKT